MLTRTHTHRRAESAHNEPKENNKKGMFNVNDRQLTHICERDKTKAEAEAKSKSKAVQSQEQKQDRTAALPTSAEEAK